MCNVAPPPPRRAAAAAAEKASASASPPLGGALNDYECGGGPAQDLWVNASAVRLALNVP